jgi:m7GpppX diphosphatase
MGLCDHGHDYVLMGETPEMNAGQSMAHFIEQEVGRPSKQWICSIIEGNQEQEEVIHRTTDYVLLPDTERANRYWRITHNVRLHSPRRRVLNWLAIAHDKQLRTLRDLRGCHVPMLQEMLDTCTQIIENETGIRRDQVMAYVHYPPSVYQLHVHFSYPYTQYCHRNTFRVHNLLTIINNLQIDPDYYAKATLYMAVFRQSLHFSALFPDPPKPTELADTRQAQGSPNANTPDPRT